MQARYMFKDGKQIPIRVIDLSITVTLNPGKTDVTSITTEQAKNIDIRIKDESIQLRSLIKGQVFAIHSQRKIEVLIRQY